MQNGESEHTCEAARPRHAFYRMLRRPSNRTFQPFNGLPNSDACDVTLVSAPVRILDEETDRQ